MFGLSVCNAGINPLVPGKAAVGVGVVEGPVVASWRACSRASSPEGGWEEGVAVVEGRVCWLSRDSRAASPSVGGFG